MEVNFALMNNCSLKQYNTLSLNAVASKMVFPYNNKGVQEIYEKYREKKIIVLGNGSNILLSKEYYNEDNLFINFKLMDNIVLEESKLKVEAGVTLSKLSWFAIENSIQGYEFLEDVPGSVGGAIIMNAGTYKDNIGQLLSKVTYYDIKENSIKTDNVKQGDFRKRSSKWQSHNYIVLSCSALVTDGDYLKSMEKLLEIKKARYLKQPRNYPNAGSVFKRPSKNGKDYFVWELFEKVGLRGLKSGGAMISDKHPGFIVNTGEATYKDIMYLIRLAQEEVKSEFDIKLELEWKII